MSSISQKSRKLVASLIPALLLCAPAVSGQSTRVRNSTNAPAAEQADPRAIFERGQAALQEGRLQQAEQDFRSVVALDPNSAAAYANLGVVYMRRKQWKPALEALHKAEQISPELAGIRLNIGLAYYKQNRFQQAIPPLESVVRDSPQAVQPRYLLGLCEFFTGDYASAANTLEPLELRESNDLNFLYVLAISAWKSKQTQLEQSAMARLVQIGGNTPEFHMLMGKAHYNREEYPEAISEFETAAEGAPRLPFLHFNLGLAYMKTQQFDKAKVEFLKDAAIEPETPYNYDQLGVIAQQQQNLKQAEEYFKHALRLDPHLASSLYQLARVYQSESEYHKALPEADLVLKIVPDNSSVHYLRGQILQHLGRDQEAKAEMKTAADISNRARNQRQQELEQTDPELSRQPGP